LECERFEFCPEVTAKATRLGLRIQEVPINYESRSAEEGKKLRWTDGLNAVRVLIRWHKWIPRTESGTVNLSPSRSAFPTMPLSGESLSLALSLQVTLILSECA